MLKKKYQKILLVLGVISISSFLINKFAPQALQNVFHSALSPIEKTFWKSGENISAFITGIFKKSDLKTENEKLISENLLLKKQLVNFFSLQNENQEFKQALCFGDENDFDLLAGEVIAQNINKDYLLINQGLTNGIEKNMPVITAEGALVGSISEVSDDFSRVQLISSTEINFDVLLQSTQQDTSTTTKKLLTKNVLGLVHGEGGGNIRIEMVPKEDEIKQGDLVITTNLGGEFPKGLIVGEISSVKRNEAEPFQEGTISPYFKLGQLNSLFIIKNFAKE